MNFNQRIRLILLVLIALPCAAWAAPFTQVVVFGDSLSDNGNLFSLVGQPGPPYFAGRASNGPVAVEDLASALGVPLVDFAMIGATTGLGNTADGGSATVLNSLPGMRTIYDVNALASAIPFDPDALYVVWGGANDMISFPADPALAVSNAVANINYILANLRVGGAQHFLVSNLPDLAGLPRISALGSGAQVIATANTILFNNALAASLGSDVVFFDAFGFFHGVVASPGAFGLTNVTTPCFNGVSACANPDQFLFWDDIHPTGDVHQVLADQFLSAVQTPEPASAALVLSAVIIFAWRARRIRNESLGQLPNV